jgi:hypothetical protein
LQVPESMHFIELLWLSEKTFCGQLSAANFLRPHESACIRFPSKETTPQEGNEFLKKPSGVKNI